MITTATNASSNSLATAADRTIDSARAQAGNALHTASDKVQALTDTLEPQLDRLSSKAKAMAHQGMDMAVHAKEKAEQSLTHYSEATSRYVSEKPVQSMVMAAAAGAALAWLFAAAVRRN